MERQKENTWEKSEIHRRIEICSKYEERYQYSVKGRDILQEELTIEKVIWLINKQINTEVNDKTNNMNTE